MLIQLMGILFFTLPQQEVVCWKNDCLKYGWTQVSQTRTSFTEHQCYRKGCDQSGWISGGTQNLQYYTQCKEKDCFSKGWYYLDRSTHEMLGNVICRNNNCLTDGWNTYFKNNPPSTTFCLEKDCRHVGWVEKNSYTFVKSYCKQKDCFTFGWSSL